MMEEMEKFLTWLKHHLIPHEGNAYRPHLLRRNWLLFFLALTLAAEGFLIASLVARESGGSFLAAVIAGDIVSLTNAERLANQAPRLTENKLLSASAQAKAEDMAAKGYFSHVGPDGKQPWAWIESAGYDYRYAGENLAVRFVDSSDVVKAWMASRSHRANLIKPVYREIGVGIANGIYKGAPATFVVQHFGAPANHVLGAAVANAGGPFDTVMRPIFNILSEPRSSTAWILGGVAAFIIMLVAFAFFFRLQIQSLELLLPGVAVAAVALFFVAFNGTFLGGEASQPAAAALGLEPGITIVGEAAATVERQ